MSYDYMLDADCDENCDLNCLTVVSEDSRREAYYKFHDIAERRIAQNLYLCTCIELKLQTMDTDDHIIEQTTEFWLGDTIKIKVCKTFFARTLGFPHKRLDLLLDHEIFEWFSKYKSFFTATNDVGMQPAWLEPVRRDTEQLCSEFVLNSR